MKKLRNLKPDQRFKKIEKILDKALPDSERYQKKYGIIDIDTLSAQQAYSLIDTRFGSSAF